MCKSQLVLLVLVFIISEAICFYHSFRYNERYQGPYSYRGNVVIPTKKRHFNTPKWVDIYNKLSSDRRRKQDHSLRRHSMYGESYNQRFPQQNRAYLPKIKAVNAERKTNIPMFSPPQQTPAYLYDKQWKYNAAERAQYASMSSRLPIRKNAVKKEAVRTPHMTNPYAMNPYYRNLYTKRIYVYDPTLSKLQTPKLQLINKNVLPGKNIALYKKVIAAKRRALQNNKALSPLVRGRITGNKPNIAKQIPNNLYAQIQMKKHAAMLMKLKNEALKIISKKHKVLLGLPQSTYINALLPFQRSSLTNNILKVVPFGKNPMNNQQLPYIRPSSPVNARSNGPVAGPLPYPPISNSKSKVQQNPSLLSQSSLAQQPFTQIKNQQMFKSISNRPHIPLLGQHSIQPLLKQHVNSSKLSQKSNQPKPPVQSGHLLQSLFDYQRSVMLRRQNISTSRPYQRSLPRHRTYARKDSIHSAKRLNIVDETEPPSRLRNASFVYKPGKYAKKMHSIKKTYVPHASSGWRRHHIFHQTSTGESKPANHPWEYKKFHVYHKVNPKHWIDTKREHLTLPYVSDVSDSLDDISDDNGFSDDDADDDPDSSNFTSNNQNEDDDDENNDLPSVNPPSHNKTPLLNIETPNMNFVPKSIKSQLEHVKPEEYDIEKDDVASSSTHEPIVTSFKSNNKMKDNDSVRKSFLGEGEISPEYVHRDMTDENHNKKALSEEEIEAMKEDQDANTLIKNQSVKGKDEEQPEILGLGKNGMTAADKASISARLGNGDVPDSSVVGKEGIDTGSMDISKEFKSHSDDLEGNSLASKAGTQHAVNKQRISDGEIDFHHVINEDMFDKHNHKIANDYESYNGVPEGTLHSDRSNEDNNDHDHAVDVRGGNNVEDTIRKLEDNDKIESEKLVKKFTSHSRYHSQQNGDNEGDDYPSDHYRGYQQDDNIPETQHYFQPNDDASDEHDSRHAEDNEDVLDPIKAGERGIHLSEEAEMSKKLNRDNAAELEKLFMKNSHASSEKNDFGTSYLEKAHSPIQSSNPVNTLTPEDALHALDGKKPLLNMLSKNNNVAEEQSNKGPPEAVKNAIISPGASEQSVENKTKFVESPKGLVGLKANTSNIAISDMENATVAKEVVSILESLGQVKTSFDGVEKPILVTENNQTQASADSKEQNVTSNINQDSQRTTLNQQSSSQANSTNNEVLNSTAEHKSNITSENQEETETKEAVHDLRIAIGILEKKLELITSAKKNGENKEIYIVDQTRTSKPITKSKIYRRVKKEKERNAASKNINSSNIRRSHRRKHHRVSRRHRISENRHYAFHADDDSSNLNTDNDDYHKNRSVMADGRRKIKMKSKRKRRRRRRRRHRHHRHSN